MISVIVPTYNRLLMLQQALQTVFEQSFRDWEVIIVDDCSNDGTFEFAEKLATEDCRVKYYRNDTNRGPGFNRNFGFNHSTGDYVIFMDDDDYYTDTTFFEKAMEIFSSNKGLACVSANALTEDVNSRTFLISDIGFLGRHNGTDYLLNLNGKYKKPLSTFATVFSRNCLQDAELHTMKMVNDIAIYMRALLFGDIFVLEGPIGNYRVHDNNISTCISRNFLLQNMEERKWVANRLRIGKREIADWYNKQIIFCFSYYVRGSHPSGIDKLKVMKWILANSHFSLKLYFSALRVIIRDSKKTLNSRL